MYYIPVVGACPDRLASGVGVPDEKRRPEIISKDYLYIRSHYRIYSLKLNDNNLNKTYKTKLKRNRNEYKRKKAEERNNICNAFNFVN